ncbi:MAG: hypothetical protein R6X16_06735 [Anaerolineae bacterium]
MQRLCVALGEHLAAAPVFLSRPDATQDSPIPGQLADVRIAHWLADRDGEAAGWLRNGPANTDASSMVQDAGTASIRGPYDRHCARTGWDDRVSGPRVGLGTRGRL